MDYCILAIRDIFDLWVRFSFKFFVPFWIEIFLVLAMDDNHAELVT